MTSRTLTLFDRICIGADSALRTIVPGAAEASRDNPANAYSEGIKRENKAHTAGLMRINHTGEVCAQALYQGQALTAKLPQVREAMNHAALEEIDHLAWCEDRVRQLNSHTSVLNPIFYGLSFTIGAVAGAIGDKYSLGFVAATEDQVCSHLREHLDQIDAEDQKSKAILNQMLQDEEVHACSAREAGGVAFTPQTKKVMSMMSKVMTTTTYRI